MKTKFEYKPIHHEDAGELNGYVNLRDVTHFIVETGEIGLRCGVVTKIAKGSRAEMGEALEYYDRVKLEPPPLLSKEDIDTLRKYSDELNEIEKEKWVKESGDG